MALRGGFSSFPVPEVLQWMDGSRRRGTLILSWEGNDRRLYLNDGRIVATANDGLWERAARILAAGRMARGEDVFAAFGDVRRGKDPVDAFSARGLELAHPVAVATDELYGALTDLTLVNQGQFHWTEDLDRSEEEWVPLDLSLRQLLFESLRWVDEQPDVDRALAHENCVVHARVPPTADLPVYFQIVLALAERGLSLGKLRLALGSSRSVITRRVFDMLRQELVAVEGAGEIEADPIATMLEKGSVLVREQQFEAAGLIFSSLLASDPSDRRVREFAHMVEQEHLAALYGDLPPLDVPTLVNDPEAMALLRQEERQIAQLVNGTWDVSTIVLASKARELDTLKTLLKLRRMGLLR